MPFVPFVIFVVHPLLLALPEIANYICVVS